MKRGAELALVRLVLALALAAVVAVVTLAAAAVILFAGLHFCVGGGFNVGVRWITGRLYRRRPATGKQLLVGVLAFGTLVSAVLLSAPLYPDPWGVLARPGFLIALAGYYFTNWLFEMNLESEAAMRAEEKIITTQIKMRWVAVRHRIRLWWLARLGKTRTRWGLGG